MGYANTTIVNWGVQLTPNESEKLHDYLRNNNILNDDYQFEDKDYTEYPCVPNLPSHIDGIEQPYYDTQPRYRTPRYVHYVELCSDETDSRIHSLVYEPGFIHYFGIYCGSKGYAHTDNINHIMNNIPQKAKDNFDKFCKPILEELNLNSTPSIQVYSQVW